MAALTVIVPTFRRPELLRRAVASALAQTFRDLAVVVYDNASGDETEDVVAGFARRDGRVAYVRRERNIGGPENFVRALDDVTSEYFAFLSDDDALFPRCYEVCMRGFARAPEAMMSAGSTVEVDSAGRVRFAPLALWPRDGVYRPPESVLEMLDNRHPTWTSVVFKSDAVRVVGGLDPGVGLPGDLDLELRIAARFPIAIDRTPCAAFFAHGESNTSRQDVAVADGMTVMASKLAADSAIPSKTREAVSLRLARQIRFKLFEICVKALVRGDDDVAQQSRERLGLDPHARMLSALCGAAIFSCRYIPGARSLLRTAESVRLRARSRRAASALHGYDVNADLRLLEAVYQEAKASRQA